MQYEDNHSLELSIGIDGSSYRYEEPDFMETEGMMYGITYSARYLFNPRFSVIFDGRYSNGSLDYSSEGTGSLDNMDNLIRDNRLSVGFTSYDNSTAKLTVYAGLGYRNLFNAGENMITTTGAYGYDRESQYIYSPIGVDLKFNLQKGWAITVNAEYDYFWKGKQISSLGYLPGYDDLTNTQNDGKGMRFALEFSKTFFDNTEFIISPYYRTWEIEDSEFFWDESYRSYFYEPANNTKEIGVNVSLKLSLL